MSFKSLSLRPFIPILLIICIGCGINLAPHYDQALVSGLSKANAEVMGFLALTSDGTNSNTYKDREEKYAHLIGCFNALEIQAKARPIPSNDIVEEINEFLSKRGMNILDDSEYPSAHAISKISESITKMRDTDKKQGVTATEVLAFKNQINIYMDQALTYESFLKR